MTQIDRRDIDRALDDGNLWAAMMDGRYWRLRRNGRTRLWKTQRDRFEIPVKCGIRSYATITQYSHVGLEKPADFIISETNPNDRKK
jgi:hypothetical protein